MADYTQMWTDLGLDLKAHDGLLSVLGEGANQVIFLLPGLASPSLAAKPSETSVHTRSARRELPAKNTCPTRTALLRVGECVYNSRSVCMFSATGLPVGIYYRGNNSRLRLFWIV